MILCLFDRAGSKVENQAYLRMLFTMVLISKNGYITGDTADLIVAFHAWSKKTEQEKFEQTIIRINRQYDLDTSTKFSQTLNRLYSTIHKSRQVPNKKKVLIVSEQKALKVLNSNFDDTLTWLNDTAISKGIHEIISLFDPALSRFERTKPFLAIKADSTQSLIFAEKSINLLGAIFKFEDGITLLDGSIYEFEKGCHINTTAAIAGDVTFLTDDLFYIPAPETLNLSQVLIVRNELSNIFWNFFDELEKLNVELFKICFEKNNFETILDLYNKTTEKAKPLLQQAINECTVLSQLKSETPECKLYKVEIAIASFETILNYYLKKEIEKESIVPYVKEEIEKEKSIKNSKLFLIISDSDQIKIT